MPYKTNVFILICAALLDLILGDPYWFPHPVKLIGKIISIEEKTARKIASSKTGLKMCGFFIAAINVTASFCITFFLLSFLKEYKIIHFCFSVWLCYTCIAARCLHKEAGKVRRALNINLTAARKSLSNIVGRDTQHLSEEGILRACVETVAENSGDGVIAPLFFMMLFGAAGGIAYKAVNTMDSMLGYNNEKYSALGFFPAKLDDIANYIPARLCVTLMLLGSVFCFGQHFNLKNGFTVWHHDCRKHASPNSGHPESAAAGLLGVTLGGPNYYSGILEQKPYIGVALKKIERTDITRSIVLMYSAEFFLFIFYLIFAYLNYITV